MQNSQTSGVLAGQDVLEISDLLGKLPLLELQHKCFGALVRSEWLAAVAQALDIC